MIESSEYQGDKCPNCESENIIGDSFDPDGYHSAYRNCDCSDCGATWTEIYEVAGYDNLSIEG